MRKLGITLGVILGTILGMWMTGCSNKTIKEVTEEKFVDVSACSFPKDWCGTWSGNLEIYNHKGKLQELPMHLEVLPTDSLDRHQWIITYIKDSLTTDLRAYELVTVDSLQGLYQIDEKNSIIIDAYLIENEFISVFEVMGNILEITYRHEGDYIAFEIVMFSSSEVSITGDTLSQGEEIPMVKSYPIKITQKAQLYKTLQ